MPTTVRQRTWIAWIPNLLSVARGLMAITFPFLKTDELRLAWILAGALTDLLDGLIARVFHAQSSTGKWLDPLADKMLLLSALITFAVAGKIQWWQAGIVVARDVVVIGMLAVVLMNHDTARFKRAPTALLGKVTTAMVFLWILSLLIPRAQPYERTMFWLAAACSIVTAIDYTIRFVRMNRSAS